MKTLTTSPFTRSLAAVSGLFLLGISPMKGQSSYDPSTKQTFEQVVQGMKALRWYNFGTQSGKTVSNLQQLATIFNPYGIAGTTVIQKEWERYQPFNSTNFVFTGNSLDLTATISGGGVYPGGIKSGQIWSKETFQPTVTGYNVYGFMVRMKFPPGKGMWPAIWLYAQQPGKDNGSEIDNPEFLMMQNQNQYDWTGFDHGPNAGADIYSIKSNPWTWRPGMDFSADYHDYELIWTPDATYKYVDGRLVYAQYFKYTSPGAAQLGINLAVGSSADGLPGLQPNSASEFPAVMSIQYMCIWGK